MLGLDDQKSMRISLKLIGRCMISCFFVFFTQFALSIVPRFFAASSLLIQLPLSALLLLVLLGTGRCCRRFLGVYASAPAFVFFNLLFIWGVYIVILRKVISPLMGIVLNGEVVMLIIGLYSILSSDPGFVTSRSSCSDNHAEDSFSEDEAHFEGSFSSRRVRYCKSCKAYVKGFDHHCPAFGNCIGQKNHVLFMVLLIGFVITEASYIMDSFKFATKFQKMDETGQETSLSENLVISTMLFCLLQVLWQGVFLTWHIYCVCVNIRTDEWINWKKYPEFQIIIPIQPGLSSEGRRFRNPYNKGVFCNMKDFLASEE